MKIFFKKNNMLYNFHDLITKYPVLADYLNRHNPSHSLANFCNHVFIL